MSNEASKATMEACEAHLALCSEIEAALWHVLRSGQSDEDECERLLISTGVRSAGLLLALNTLRDKGPDAVLEILQERFLELVIMVEDHLPTDEVDKVPTKH